MSTRCFSRRVTRWIVTGLAAVCGLAPVALPAQVDPRGPVRTISTTHLRVHYPAALDSLARLAAVQGEVAYAQLARELAPPRGRIDMLVTDNVDVSNGFAQVFPTNRVVVYAVPPLDSRELRFHDDWLRQVITHELAHIFHIDRARGVWSAGRLLFGRNPLFFPNAFLPSWVKEGLAVHYETSLTGSGRALATEYPQLLRTAARDSAIVPFGRWSLSTTRFPAGQVAYGYGTLVMDRLAQQSTADSSGRSSMRRFVDVTAAHLLPFRLGYTSRLGFGESFQREFAALRDSVQRAAIDRRGDSVFTVVSPDGWYAAAPRWLGNDSLAWSASNGREVTGLYVAPVQGGAPRRVAWRNGLEVNVPVDSSEANMVFAQVERRDPFVVRRDLYRRQNGRDVRLTYGARLGMPDVRSDGSMVAVEYGPNSARLVRVSADGQLITPLTPITPGERWAEPRWSPNGEQLAAVQLLPTGEQRVVVLDAAGTMRQVIAGARAVFATPAWAPSGRRLVWTSDRSGRMQVETAPVAEGAAMDTLRWREPRADVQQITHTSTGTYEPSISPDGSKLVALVERVDGAHVAWAPFDTVGPMAENTWYPARNRVTIPSLPDSARVVAQPSRSYSAVPMLLPRYWLPLLGEARRGDVSYGVSSSGVDILERHAWSASVLVEPRTRETDIFAGYRYAGLGVPVSDISFSQEWDGTFVVRDNDGDRLGLVARRRRFLTVSSTWSVPRIRWAFSGTLGAQYEMRDFTAPADSILGPANSPVRLGTRYPSFFVNTGYSTARRALRGVSVEEGFTFNTSTQYRWREDQTATGSWRTVLSGRGYVPLALPGYARHVLALRATAGVADVRTQSEFSVGGVSGTSSELLPGVVVGDPSRPFSVRGTAPGVQRGTRAVAGSVEYRAPLLMFRSLPGPFTLYGDRLAFTVFSDAGRAWCPGNVRTGNVNAAALCDPRGVRDGWLASAGAELVLDLAVQYDVPYRLRVGGAVPYAAPNDLSRKGALYVTLGGFF